MGLSIQDGKNFERLLAGCPTNSLDDSEWREQYDKYGIGKIRKSLRENLRREMQEVRDNQPGNPSMPKNYFAKELIYSVDEAMNEITEIDNGERFDLRFYSAVDTRLDYAGGFDCWIELIDKKEGKILSDCKVDITSNQSKTIPSNFADLIYYFDPIFNDDDAKGKIDPSLFASKDYKKLVASIARILLEDSGIELSN